MARKKPGAKNKPEKKTEKKEQASSHQPTQASQAHVGAQNISNKPQAPTTKVEQSGLTNPRGEQPGPRPSSLNEALYLWLSKKPASVQNIILTVFGICAVLFFSAKVIDAANALWRLIPTRIPKIYGVIRNESDHDVAFSKTGNFTIQASPNIQGLFELCTDQDEPATDSTGIIIPRDGNEVNVYAKLPKRSDVRDQYKRGEYPLTLTVITPTKRYMDQIERFSKIGVKQKWTITIPKNTMSERTLKVCFDELDEVEKNCICQGEPDLSPPDDLVFLEGETKQLKECLEYEVERGDFFKLISVPYFDKIRDGKETPPSPDDVMSKIAIGVYKQKKTGQKKMLWRLTDSQNMIKNSDHGGRYPIETQENIAHSIISEATTAIVRVYPIVGRISDASREDGIVEMQIGKLTGVRKGMILYAYCGEILNSKHIGDIKITNTWQHTCEGVWRPKGIYEDREALTSLIVSSEWKEAE
jgi:hypothetical protein